MENALDLFLDDVARLLLGIIFGGSSSIGATSFAAEPNMSAIVELPPFICVSKAFASTS